MIDVNVVREGTRWSFGGAEVTVVAVAKGFVVFYAADEPARVSSVEDFAAGAHDPATADYHRLLDKLTTSSTSGPDVVDALVYLLKRLGPPAPLNVAPSVPLPAKLEPAVMPAELDPKPEVCAADALVDECVVEAEPKLNRFKQPRGDRSTNRWV